MSGGAKCRVECWGAKKEKLRKDVINVMKSFMVCSLHLSSYDDPIKEDEMGDVFSGNVEVINNSFLQTCMAETAWQDFAWGSGRLGTSNEVVFSRTPDRLGPSSKYMENSTKLCCLEITVYRIKYSTLLCLLELQMRRIRKV